MTVAVKTKASCSIGKSVVADAFAIGTAGVGVFAPACAHAPVVANGFPPSIPPKRRLSHGQITKSAVSHREKGRTLWRG